MLQIGDGVTKSRKTQTTLEIFYTVNVIRGNDLSYDACKKVQERPYSAFPAKG